MPASKTFAFIAAVLAVSALGYGGYRIYQSYEDDGGAADDDPTTEPVAEVHTMQYVDEEGVTRSLSAFKGKYLIVDLTGVGCEYCPYQYDYLRDVIDETSANDVAVLSVEVWGATVSEMDVAAAEHGIDWQWGVDVFKTFGNKWGTGVPRVLIVDPEGAVIWAPEAGVVSANEIMNRLP